MAQLVMVHLPSSLQRVLVCAQPASDAAAALAVLPCGHPDDGFVHPFIPVSLYLRIPATAGLGILCSQNRSYQVHRMFQKIGTRELGQCQTIWSDPEMAQRYRLTQPTPCLDCWRTARTPWQGAPHISIPEHANSERILACSN